MKQIGLWGPKDPPTLRSLTESLRGLNRLFKEPFTVSLNEKGLVALADTKGPRYGLENLPGSALKFDAPAAARRLLAALRDLEPASR
jgi:hypothetical protein